VNGNTAEQCASKNTGKEKKQSIPFLRRIRQSLHATQTGIEKLHAIMNALVHASCQ
jgi:hypothetical protein